MRWTIEQAARATGATVAGPTGSPGAEAISGVSIDTRTMAPGELFVAVRAERDGHEFAAAAAAAGAAALLVERETGTDLPELVVADTAAALLDLGRAARQRLPGPVIGITGSVGKTSTKDMAAAALATARRTVASPRSFNNELGLPLTLANASEDAEVVVLEMGARGPGHIALLCRAAGPTIGVVTSVAAAHTEMFGDLDGVARAKGELVEALPASGFAVLNGDDPRTRSMSSRTVASTVLYSVRDQATSTVGAGAAAHPDVIAEDVTLDAELRPRYRLRSPWGTADVRLEARGAHQVGNSLAALTLAALAGVALDQAVEALGRAGLSPHRMELLYTPDGGVIINDAYNANPASMEAALEALAAVPAQHRVAVLGTMAELGAQGPAEHRAVAALAGRLGVDLIVVGTAEYGVEPAADADEAVARLGRVGAGTAVLVKASRVAALEQVAARLVDPPERR
jgi:UDP-N-acetylmuramoyl-tripeptide--D-alanyl-D-alanine ligase